MRWLLLIAIAWLPSLCAAPLPDTLHARYEVYKDSMLVAEMDESYSRTADHYTLTSTAHPLGLLAVFRPGKIVLHSTGNITAQGLQPLQFDDQREGESHQDSHANFAWDTHQLALAHDGQHTSLDLPPGTQDRLSAMYQFMFVEPATQLDFAMTNGSKLDLYHYQISAGELLTTPAGKFNTLHLDSGAKPGETRTQIWLMTDRYHLPCKLIITDPDGGTLTQELRALDSQP